MMINLNTLTITTYWTSFVFFFLNKWGFKFNAIGKKFAALLLEPCE